MNLSGVLEHHADRHPDRLALEFAGEESTYTQLLARVRRTAGALRDAGVERGDVVALLLYNSLDFLNLMFATAHLGAIFMPLNWRLAGPELEYIVNHAGTKVLVSEEQLEDRVAGVREELRCETFLRLGRESSEGWRSLDEARERADPVLRAAEVSGDDVHRLMYTSGTTSRPKGVMITYANLYWKNVVQAIELGAMADDRGLACGPLYHVGALDLTTTTHLYVGATTHILRRFDAREVLDAIERHRITAIWLAPAMVHAIMGEPSIERRDLSTVRLIINGGEKMPLPLIEKTLASFPNAWFADAYGLTETVSGDTFLDREHARSKIGSVGKPVLHHEVRIVDDAGRDVGPGEQGEILVRGPKVFKGYWRDEKATAAVMVDGWFHTGDIGTIDEDGFLYILDRLKDVIISGGENITSLEIERALYEHEAVSEVAVVARPDDRWGEVPVGYVAVREGEQIPEGELIAFCRERLAKYKVPRAIRFVDALPRNPSGKVLKRELRDRELNEGRAATREGAMR